MDKILENKNSTNTNVNNKNLKTKTNETKEIEDNNNKSKATLNINEKEEVPQHTEGKMRFFHMVNQGIINSKTEFKKEFLKTRYISTNKLDVEEKYNKCIKFLSKQEAERVACDMKNSFKNLKLNVILSTQDITVSRSNGFFHNDLLRRNCEIIYENTPFIKNFIKLIWNLKILSEDCAQKSFQRELELFDYNFTKNMRKVFSFVRPMNKQMWLNTLNNRMKERNLVRFSFFNLKIKDEENKIIPINLLVKDKMQQEEEVEMNEKTFKEYMWFLKIFGVENYETYTKLYPEFKNTLNLIVKVIIKYSNNRYNYELFKKYSENTIIIKTHFLENYILMDRSMETLITELKHATELLRYLLGDVLHEYIRMKNGIIEDNLLKIIQNNNLPPVKYINNVLFGIISEGTVKLSSSVINTEKLKLSLIEKKIKYPMKYLVLTDTLEEEINILNVTYVLKKCIIKKDKNTYSRAYTKGNGVYTYKDGKYFTDKKKAKGICLYEKEAIEGGNNIYVNQVIKNIEKEKLITKKEKSYEIYKKEQIITKEKLNELKLKYNLTVNNAARIMLSVDTDAFSGKLAMSSKLNKENKLLEQAISYEKELLSFEETYKEVGDLILAYYFDIEEMKNLDEIFKILKNKYVIKIFESTRTNMSYAEITKEEYGTKHLKAPSVYIEQKENVILSLQNQQKVNKQEKILKKGKNIKSTKENNSSNISSIEKKETLKNNILKEESKEIQSSNEENISVDKKEEKNFTTTEQVVEKNLNEKLVNLNAVYAEKVKKNLISERFLVVENTNTIKEEEIIAVNLEEKEKPKEKDNERKFNEEKDLKLLNKDNKDTKIREEIIIEKPKEPEDSIKQEKPKFSDVKKEEELSKITPIIEKKNSKGKKKNKTKKKILKNEDQIKINKDIKKKNQEKVFTEEEKELIKSMEISPEEEHKLRDQLFINLEKANVRLNKLYLDEKEKRVIAEKLNVMYKEKLKELNKIKLELKLKCDENKDQEQIINDTKKLRTEYKEKKTQYELLIKGRNQEKLEYENTIKELNDVINLKESLLKTEILRNNNDKYKNVNTLIDNKLREKYIIKKRINNTCFISSAINFLISTGTKHNEVSSIAQQFLNDEDTLIKILESKKQVKKSNQGLLQQDEALKIVEYYLNVTNSDLKLKNPQEEYKEKQLMLNSKFDKDILVIKDGYKLYSAILHSNNHYVTLITYEGDYYIINDNTYNKVTITEIQNYKCEVNFQIKENDESTETIIEEKKIDNNLLKEILIRPEELNVNKLYETQDIERHSRNLLRKTKMVIQKNKIGNIRINKVFPEVKNVIEKKFENNNCVLNSLRICFPELDNKLSELKDNHDALYEYLKNNHAGILEFVKDGLLDKFNFLKNLHMIEKYHSHIGSEDTIELKNLLKSKRKEVDLPKQFKVTRMCDIHNNAATIRVQNTVYRRIKSIIFEEGHLYVFDHKEKMYLDNKFKSMKNYNEIKTKKVILTIYMKLREVTWYDKLISAISYESLNYIHETVCAGSSNFKNPKLQKPNEELKEHYCGKIKIIKLINPKELIVLNMLTILIYFIIKYIFILRQIEFGILSFLFDTKYIVALEIIYITLLIMCNLAYVNNLRKYIKNTLTENTGESVKMYTKNILWKYLNNVQEKGIRGITKYEEVGKYYNNYDQRKNICKKERREFESTYVGKLNTLQINECKALINKFTYVEKELDNSLEIFSMYIKNKSKKSIRHMRERENDSRDLSEFYLDEYKTIEAEVNVYYEDILDYTPSSVIQHEYIKAKKEFVIILPFHQDILKTTEAICPTWGGKLKITNGYLQIEDKKTINKYHVSNYNKWIHAKEFLVNDTISYKIKEKVILSDHLIIWFSTDVIEGDKKVIDNNAKSFVKIAIQDYGTSNILINNYRYMLCPKYLVTFALSTINSKQKTKSLTTQGVINYLKKLWRENDDSFFEKWFENIDKIKFIHSLNMINEIQNKIDSQENNTNSVVYESLKNIVVYFFSKDTEELKYLRDVLYRDLKNVVNFNNKIHKITVEDFEYELKEENDYTALDVNSYKYDKGTKKLMMGGKVIENDIKLFNVHTKYNNNLIIEKYHNLYETEEKYVDIEDIEQICDINLRVDHPESMITKNYSNLIITNPSYKIINKLLKNLKLHLVGDKFSTTKECGNNDNYYLLYNGMHYVLKRIKNTINFNNELKLKIKCEYNIKLFEFLENKYISDVEKDSCFFKAVYGSSYHAFAKPIEDKEHLRTIAETCVREKYALIKDDIMYINEYEKLNNIDNLETYKILFVEENHVTQIDNVDTSILRTLKLKDIKDWCTKLNGVITPKLVNVELVTNVVNIKKPNFITTKNKYIKEWFNYEYKCAEYESESIKHDKEYMRSKIYSGMYFVSINGKILYDNDPEEYALTEKGIEKFNENLIKTRKYVISSNVLNFYRSMEIINNIEDIKDYNIIVDYIQGYPGCGKSTLIVESAGEFDIVCTPSKLNAKRLRNQVKCITKTLDSVCINGIEKKQYNIMYVDEIDKCHFGQVLYVAMLTRCKKIVCVGDKNQIEYFSRLPEITFKYNTYNESHVKVIKKTYRCPQSHVRILGKNYYPGITSENKKEGRIETIIINSINDVKDVKGEFITFTQWEKSEIKRNKKEVHTLGEYQGESANFINIIRLSKRNDNPLYEDDKQIAVALSRSKDTLRYYTCTIDKLYKLLSGAVINESEKLNTRTEKLLSKRTNQYSVPIDIYVKHVNVTPTRDTDDTLDRVSNTSGIIIDKNVELIEVENRYLESYITQSNSTVNNETISNIMYELHDHHREIFEYIRNEKEYEIPKELYIQPDKFIQSVIKKKSKEEYCNVKIFNNVNLQENTTNLLLENLEKRNLASKPNHKYISDNTKIKINKLINKVFDEEKLSIYKKEVLHSNMSGLKKWYAKRTKLQRNRIEADTNRIINKYYAHLKREEKPDLENNDKELKPKNQIVVASTAMVTSYFAAHFSMLNMYLENCLKDKYVYYNGLNAKSLQNKLNKNKSGYFRAIDISKFDKSQLEICTYIFQKIMEKCGVNKTVIDTYKDANVYAKVNVPEIGARFSIEYTKKSGEFTTYMSNSVITLIVVLFCEEIEDENLIWYLFGGDDNLIYTINELKENKYKNYVDVFNMECKYDNYTRYFASRFLIINRGNFMLVSDPMKLIKSFTKYMLCKEHIELYHISYKDNTKNMSSNSVQMKLVNAMYEKYITYFPKLNKQICYIIIQFIMNLREKERFLEIYSKNKNYNKALDINVKSKMIAELKAREILSVEEDLTY